MDIEIEKGNDVFGKLTANMTFFFWKGKFDIIMGGMGLNHENLCWKCQEMLVELHGFDNVALHIKNKA